MNEHAQPRVVRNYLRELDIALAGVSDVERCAIVEGATEELSGLDTEAAAARIEKLGDPGFIAAEARAENRTDPAASVVTTGGEPRWYVVVASLLVAFGGIVVPLLGWIAGIVMVWMSKSWRTWEKWVGTLAAPLITVLAVLIPSMLFASPSGANVGNGEVSNPLLPVFYDVAWSGILFFTVLNVAVGLWLLVMALRRRVQT